MVDEKVEGNFEHCPPEPEAMISSLRAFGYDLSMAIADLIDNSIFAGAKIIEIDYDWNNGKPWIRIIDDGNGMSEPCLKDAMRLGSQSPLKERDANDLGRFGLGLKTASFSQCRLLTVKTKLESGEVALRCWDLDHVVSSNRWELSTKAPYGGAQLLNCLDPMTHGTVVLWQKIDRVIQEEKECDQQESDNAAEHFIGRFKMVAQYLEMVFHRYLTGNLAVSIKIGRHQCGTWDPFLTGNQFTQELSTERFDDGKVVVTPYVLPHVSKRAIQETEMGSGLYGWNAHQGFYVYRNRRMIIPGGYLDFDLTPEEHFKLCRIQVDLPNNLDHDWSIDVRKASASPPARIRADLERIAKATRAKAVQIYRARTGHSRNTGARKQQYDVWIRKKRGDKILYEINLEHPVIISILNEVKPKKSWINKLFHLIENTVPHRVIIQDNAEHEDCHVGLPPAVAKPPDELLELCRRMFEEQIRKGKPPQDAADFVCAVFDDHIDYRVMLDKLIEEMK
jgi:hypothetical protein